MKVRVNVTIQVDGGEPIVHSGVYGLATFTANEALACIEADIKGRLEWLLDKLPKAEKPVELSDITVRKGGKQETKFED
jgi:hypothetical protein